LAWWLLLPSNSQMCADTIHLWIIYVTQREPHGWADQKLQYQSWYQSVCFTFGPAFSSCAELCLTNPLYLGIWAPEYNHQLPFYNKDKLASLNHTQIWKEKSWLKIRMLQIYKCTENWKLQASWWHRSIDRTSLTWNLGRSNLFLTQWIVFFFVFIFVLLYLGPS